MKGILFKPDVWRAKQRVLEQYGEAQTRRIIKASNSTVCGYCVRASDPSWRGLVWDESVTVDHGPHILHPYPSQYLHVPFSEPDGEDDGRVFRVRSRLEVGDVVYIKEAWWTYSGSHGVHFALTEEPPKLSRHFGKLHSPMFLKATDARYFIQITNVKPQRLQEITDSDAIQEGVLFMGGMTDNWDEAPWCASLEDQEPMKYPHHAYARLWDSINPKYPYSSNPWVWVNTFTKVVK